MVNRADRISKAIRDKGISFAELEHITGVSKPSEEMRQKNAPDS